METKWYFAQDMGEKDHLSDSEVEIFRTKGDGPDAFKGIAREVIQNSIDAKNTEIKAPLVVKFDLLDIPKSQFPDLNGLAQHVQGTIDFCENNGKKNIALNNSKKQIATLEQDSYTVLKISDLNTKGVSGSDDLDSGKSKWKGLVYNDGDTIKDSASSLGSFGLGKNASFAISTLRTVFYVTRDLMNNYAMEGVAKLYTSFTGGQKYVSEGYFCNEENRKTTPLNEEQALAISPIFKRDEYGTDVIIFEPNIALFRDKVKWYLIESVISNFFMAFVDGDLEVIVNGTEINQKNLTKVFTSLLSFYEDNSETISPKLISVRQYLDTLENGEDFTEEVDNFGEIFLKLHKTPDTKFKNVAIFREHGMLIKEYTVNSANQKFSGVLVVKGKEGINFLKSIEDPNHSDFDPSRETDDQSLTPSAKKTRLNQFYNWIASNARKFTHIDTSGSISLSGMEDYIQMPEDGEKVTKEKPEIQIKKIKRNRKKEKERIYEKVHVTEEANGLDTPSIDHTPGPVNPEPNPNDYDPEPKNRVPDPDSKKKGLIKLYSASFEISPVMSRNENECTLIFKTTAKDKLLNLKVTAVGEDGKENNLLPKLISALDVNKSELLEIKNGIITGISSEGISKIRLKFDSKLLSRIKPYVYWEEEV